MRSRTWADADLSRGERAARALLARLGVVKPTETEIDNLAFLAGVLVRDVPMSGAQGRLARVGSKAIISVNDTVTYRPRRRFVVAHELGHFELHDDRNNLSLCTEDQITENYDAGTEREANAFAAEFLMPRQLWAKLTDVKQPTLDVISRLGDDFDVAFTAAAIRFVKLCPERCAIAFSKDNKAIWYALAPDFGYAIRRGPLDTYTLASDYFRKGRVNQSPETVSAQAWIDNSRVTGDHDLIEHCRPIPSIGATLSLLWIKPDSDF
jgi:Zn-dependent peptidase ImmA (M78 family)